MPHNMYFYDSGKCISLIRYHPEFRSLASLWDALTHISHQGEQLEDHESHCLEKIYLSSHTGKIIFELTLENLLQNLDAVGNSHPSQVTLQISFALISLRQTDRLFVFGLKAILAGKISNTIIVIVIAFVALVCLFSIVCFQKGPSIMMIVMIVNMANLSGLWW